MTTRSLLSILFCAVLVLLAAPDAQALDVLLVTNNNGYLTTQESYRKSRFESWGHTVNTIWDEESQAAFDAACNANDVAYVCEEVNANNLSYKLRSAPIGVVSEERYLDVEFGFSTSDGSETSDRYINITDNSHDITSSFSTGSLRITSSWQPLVYMNGTSAPDGQTLATVSSRSALFVVEAGGTLANTYDGSSTATGRRVRLPFGGTNFDFSRLRSDALILLEETLTWAALRTSATGLIGHWKLNDTSGTAAVDSSDNHNDGTYTGGVTLNAEGPYPGEGSVAASFDGSSGYVAVPNESDYDLTSAISIAVWLKVDSFDATWQAIICKGDSAWRLSRNANTNTLHFALTGVNPLSLNGTVDVNDGEWHHVVCTYDGSTKRLYVDGQLDVSANVSGSISTNNYDVLIGANGQAGGREWCGSLFDVRVYDYALTDKQVAELYGLVGHWKLDETSGTTAADSSGAGNDGVYTNNPTLGVSHTPFDDGVELAVGFDGTNDYVEVPYDATLDSLSYTVSAWVYNEDTASTFYNGIIGTRHVGTTYGFDLKVEANRVHGDIPAEGESWLDTAVDIRSSDTGADGQGGRLSLSKWYMVTYVVNSVDGTAELYLDADLKRTISLSGTPRFIRPGQVLRLGVAATVGTGQNEYLLGRLDDVRLYNRALSATEMQDLYGESSPSGVRIIKWVEVQ